jgi:hypothetical protein
MSMLYLSMKAMQLFPNALGGAMMSLDFLHGKVSSDMVPKLGFPAWFPTALGLFKLTQATLNWYASGLYTPIAQFLFAAQLGGAVFTHAVIEEKLAGCVPCAVFFANGVAVHVLHGSPMSLPMIVAAHSALAVVGFVMGFVVVALGRGGSKAAIALSPVKFRKQRGF